MFEAWALIEIMGHVQLAGKVSEEVVFGAPMVRIDVPATPAAPAFIRYYGAQAIYSITPVPEEVAVAMARRLSERPWQPGVVGVALPPGAPADDVDEPDGPDWDDDELDDDFDDFDDEDEDDEPDDLEDDRRSAAKWAYELLRNPAGFVILDTETTGLGQDAEACQIAVIDQTGAILLDTLVKPPAPIPAGATAVHGIDDAMAADAPGAAVVLPQVQAALTGRQLVIWNASYDLSVLRHMVQALDQPIPLAAPGTLFGYERVDCAMQQYAAFRGEWNDYRGSYRWQKLADALAQQGITHVGTLHSALGDCQATLKVIEAMAAWYEARIAPKPDGIPS